MCVIAPLTLVGANYAFSTNTEIPNPLGCTVVSAIVPLESCDEAADILRQYLGPEDLRAVVGGSFWWTVRGLNGIEAEWLATKQDRSNARKRRRMRHRHNGRDRKSADEYPADMDGLESVLLYLHGGGYSWGSINTHRFSFPCFLEHN